MRLHWLLLLLLVVIGGGAYFHKPLRTYYQDNVALSRAGYVCHSLDIGQVKRDEVCSKPLPEIESLRWHYAKEKVEDEAWYRARGWAYFPEVRCEGENVLLSFMGREFRCVGGKAERIRESGVGSRESEGKVFELVKSAFGQEGKGFCYGKKGEGKLHTVTDIWSDGTLMLEDKQRIQLFGVTVPKVFGGKNELCAQEAKNFLEARLGDQSAFFYFPEDNNPFSASKSIRAYVVTQQDIFINLDLIRYGLARLDDTSGQSPLHRCHDQFLTLERQAKVKELGMWGKSCR